MKYVCLVGFVCAFITWIFIMIQSFKGNRNMVIPMWVSIAFLWIFNIGMKVYG